MQKTRTEGLDGARTEVFWIVENLKRYIKWEEDLMAEIDAIADKIPYIENILAIKELGVRTVTGILSEIGDVTRITEAGRQVQKLAGLALVEGSSGKHEGMTVISKRGTKTAQISALFAPQALAAEWTISVKDYSASVS